MDIDKVAQLAGHASTQITQEVYRKGINQDAMEGAEILGR